MATYTQDEIEENLSDYADYEQLASVDRAKWFVVWARRWLIQFPANREDQHNVLTYSTVEVRRLLEAAQAYVAQNDQATSNANSSVRFFSFENFRD